MAFEITDDVRVDRDASGRVVLLEHLAQPVLAAPPGEDVDALNADGRPSPAVAASTAQALAAEYLRVVAPVYDLEDSMLPGGADDGLARGLSPAEAAPDGSLQVVDEKEVMGTTVVSFQQQFRDLPVWQAGASVTIQEGPMRATSSQVSVHRDLQLDEASADAGYVVTPDGLAGVLGLDDDEAAQLSITSTRQWIYQLDPGQRLDPEIASSAAAGGGTTALEEAPPTLPLPPLPAELEAGRHYVVTEVLFAYPVQGYGPLNWRAFVEESTGSVVYLRAFIACATGMIFRTDPATAGSNVTPTAPSAQLNPLRSTVPLLGLVGANPQPLDGSLVRLVDTAPPAVNPPTAANPPAAFFFDARAREFAAVNAYHHCDWLFRHMSGMGFNLATYFDGTSFPVPVDAVAFGDAVNARAPGNATGTGSGGFQFGLAGSPFPAVSIAADVRVVLHEFGHALLWDSVHSPNFGFAHSAGDSLAAVLLDPESSLRTDAVRRFQTFPWVLPNRNHGRDLASGWAWGGVQDVGGYNSEQILSTTMFRLYRSLGGDAGQTSSRRQAARQTAYLIFRGIGLLASNPVTPSPVPNAFATALANADIGTSNFEGYRGGAFHKVIRWAFEKQGLFQPAGAPVPVTQPGAAPPVDVFIDDGRAGQYPYQRVHWECTEIWNRLQSSPGSGPGAHQTPVVGRVNYAYVRVRNRGTQASSAVSVRGYSADPGAGLSWPVDWRPMLTPQVEVPGGIPAGGSTIVGPFRWKPRVVGHECMFMETTTPGDRSNIDPVTGFPCATGPTPEWRLVPFDNNLGQRNVCPVPAGGGIRGLLTGFVRRSITVHNPFDRAMDVVVRGELPGVLAERGWKVTVNERPDGTVTRVAGGAQRQLRIGLLPGADFTADDVKAARARTIRVLVLIDDVVVGGMSYELDPAMKRAPRETAEGHPVALDDPDIEALLAERQ